MIKSVDKSFSKRIGMLMSGTIVGQMSAFLAMPILSRIYDRSAFSDLGVYVSFCGIFSVICTLRLEAAIPIAESHFEADDLYWSAFFSCSVLSVLSGIITYILLLYEVLDVYSNPVFFALFVSISTFLIGIIQMLTALQLRHKRLNRIAQSKAAQGFFSSLSQVILGLVFHTPAAFLLGDVAGRIAGFVSFGTTREPKQPRIRLRSVLRTSRKYIDFIKFSTPAAFINSLGLQIPVFIIASFSSSPNLGIFVFCSRVIVLPSGLIAQTLSQLYVSELSSSKFDGIDKLQIFKRFLLVSLCLSLALSIFVIPPLGMIVPIFFGSQWSDAVTPLRIMFVASTFQIVGVAISQTATILEKNKLQFIWDVSRLTLVLISTIIACMLYDDITAIVLIISIVSSLSYILLIGLSFFIIKQSSIKPRRPLQERS
ncbi:lipopolysaccharide biosynthesis protein [Deinococcus rufus]|uniref:Lipopolysaccharide biosynthesis protein n=1 Tax=Deinococcus rufus TaxID=2136097 RepID=A0ABV7ZD31_9DEIO